MPWLGRARSPGKRNSGRPGGVRFSWRARVIAGEVAALAVLGGLAVAAVGAPRWPGSRPGYLPRLVVPP